MNDKRTQKRLLRAKAADGEFIAYVADSEQCSLEEAIQYFLIHPEYQETIDCWIYSDETRDVLDLLIDQYATSVE